MTPAQLLTPRAKVIAKWPFCPYKVGDIVMPNEHGVFHFLTTPYRDEFGEAHFSHDYYNFEETVKEYPHLLKILPWWEDRKLEDMPKYVRCKDPHSERFNESVHKVEGWDFRRGMWSIDCEWFEYREITPATEAEYLEFVNSKKSSNGQH